MQMGRLRRLLCSSEDELSLDYDFEIVSRACYGKFVNTYVAKDKLSSGAYTVKEFKKNEILEAEVEDEVCLEIGIQYRIRHPNILEIFGVYTNADNIYVIGEYARHGNLYTRLEEKQFFNEKTAAIFVRDLANILIYCYSHQIVPKNIRPESFLIGNRGQLVLGNFGWTGLLPLPKPTSFRMIEYYSPEMRDGQSHSYASNIYSLGVFCWELLVGLLPDHTVIPLTEEFRTLQYIMTDGLLFSLNAKALMDDLMMVDPRARLPLEMVLSHPWILENAPIGAMPDL